MSLLLEGVAWILVELLFQVLAEVLATLGFESVAQSVGARKKHHPLLAGLGCLLLGATFGFLLTLFYPHHTAPSAATRTVAMIIFPLAIGTIAAMLGSRAEAAGRQRPALATFWGGLLFAAGASITRFLVLRAGTAGA